MFLCMCRYYRKVGIMYDELKTKQIPFDGNECITFICQRERLSIT